MYMISAHAVEEYVCGACTCILIVCCICVHCVSVCDIIVTVCKLCCNCLVIYT